MSTSDIEQVRSVALALAKQAQSNKDFRVRIQNDPIAVLTAAGLPQDFVSIFLQETQLGEVMGYEMGKQTCLISDVGLIQDFIY